MKKNEFDMNHSENENKPDMKRKEIKSELHETKNEVNANSIDYSNAANGSNATDSTNAANNANAANFAPPSNEPEEHNDITGKISLTHPEFAEMIFLHLADELTEEETKKLFDHIRLCESCKKEFELQKEMLAAIKSTNPDFAVDEILAASRKELSDQLRSEIFITETSGSQPVSSEALNSETLASEALISEKHSSATIINKEVKTAATAPATNLSTGTSNATATATLTASTTAKKPDFLTKLKNYFERKETFTQKFLAPSLAGAGGLAAGILLTLLFFGKSSGEKDFFFTNIENSKESRTKIANVMFKDTEGNDGTISFTFDAYKRITVTGSPDDPNIQKLLTYSILNEKNPGTRLNSINLVNESYDKKQLEGVKEALISAAKSDDNPGVRLQALKTLATLPFDDDIKKACLHILSHDNSPGNRIEAINTLVRAIKDGFKVDDEIKSVFKQRLDEEENPYIIIKTKSVLEGKEM